MIDNPAYDDAPRHEVIIHTILDSTWTRYGKYRVELSFLESEKRVYWLTEKQMLQLQQCMDWTPKGYSCKKACVTAVFDDKGHYRYAKTYFGKRGFNMPPQFNLECLRDD